MTGGSAWSFIAVLATLKGSTIFDKKESVLVDRSDGLYNKEQQSSQKSWTFLIFNSEKLL